MTILIKEVKSKTDRLAFFNFAKTVYRDDGNWVPHLWPQRKAYLEKEIVFFTYGEGDFWIVEKDGQVAATFGAAVDHASNEESGEKAAVFGFLEMFEDYAVAKAAWDHASEWAKDRGMESLKGPYSFSTNEYGFLVEGFDTSPAVMQTHTPPYYAEFAERYGFEVELEKLAYRLHLSKYDFDVEKAPRILHRIADRAKKRHGLDLIRKGREEVWHEEVRRIHPLYNKALGTLEDFTPIDLAEFQSQAGSLKPVLDPDLVLIAEKEGDVIGLLLGIPNIAEAFKKANGLRYPWDYLRFQLARRQITGVTLKIMAIDPEFWGYGLDAMMFLEIGEALVRKGYTWIDASLTSASNPFTNKLATKLGGEVYRRYKTYKLTF